MRIKTRILRIGLSVILAGFLFGVSGCTKYASEEDLQALERQKQAALSAEAKIEQLNKEKADLEAKLAAKQRELAEVQKTLDQIRRD